MYQLYNLILRVLMPFVLLRLLFKSRKLPAYRQRIRERFAKQVSLHKVDIWVHAVSLGEVIAVSPLIERLLTAGYQLIVTTTTPTGSQKLVDTFQDRIQHQYLPYDLPNLQKRFLQQVQPKLILLMETEIWPNLIKQAKKQNIQVAIINARLSERSLQGYNKISALIAPVLQEVDAVLSQSESDAKRFRHLAMNTDKPHIEVIGNIKFDQPGFADRDRQPMLEIQERWGKQRPVLILASTHDDEEKQILEQLPLLKQAVPDLIVLVAPRHPERFQVVFEQAKNMAFITYRRSQSENIKSDAEVIIIDCVGELVQWYSLSSVAFVGGSLVPVGGHNVLEPVVAGVPVLTGPNMHNFVKIAQLLSDAKAMISVKDVSELTSIIIDLLTNPSHRKQLIDAANQVLAENQGALLRYEGWIKRHMPEKNTVEAV